MSLTSAASGENYRNWWPHPIMTAFTDHSIDLLEEIARRCDNRIHITRRGYALATRQAKPDHLLQQLHTGYGAEGARRIRVHGAASLFLLRTGGLGGLADAPEGVDVIQNPELIRRHFPTFDTRSLHHPPRPSRRRYQRAAAWKPDAGGDPRGGRHCYSGARHRNHPAGRWLRAEGARRGRRADARCRGSSSTPPALISATSRACWARGFRSRMYSSRRSRSPISLGAIDRNMPFSIDLDGQAIDWTDEERQLLEQDPATAWLARPMPGGIHCRPEGGEHGKWIKLGWAYNRTAVRTASELPTDPQLSRRSFSRREPAQSRVSSHITAGCRGRSRITAAITP